MKLTIKQSNLNLTPFQFLRSAGYHAIYNRKAGQESFVRAFGRGHYPRFHIYITEEGDLLTVNLHLDQKQPSYKGISAHSGEYDSPVVKTEMDRLKVLLKTVSTTSQSTSQSRLKVSSAPTGDPRSQRWSDMLRRM